MARFKRPAGATTRKEKTRQKKLAEVRARAREIAELAVRLPADIDQVRGSQARRDLLSRYGLTAATEADWGHFHHDEVEFVAQATDHYAMWFGAAGGSWINGEHYQPGRDETMQIAAEELQRARGANP